MSIRNALIGGMLLVATVAVGIVAAVGAISINRSVVREAQARVNHALETMASLYEQNLDTVGQQMHSLVGEPGIGTAGSGPAPRLKQWREELDFTVLNLCDADGRPLAGTYPDRQARVPVRQDPVLRRALAGKPVRGTVLLAPDRLELEGGPALCNLVAVPGDEAVAAAATDSALFRWFAVPVRDEAGRVVALLYGGRALNHNYPLVDAFRDVLFGTERHRDKPLGTVTVFLGDVRVATNVLRADGERAVGTRVSEAVRKQVLERGRRWQDRAWVVDAWYLSGYEPLRDPDGRTIGMLYVGLLEAPYSELRTSLLARFLLPVAAVLVAGLLGVALVVRRITRPLASLRQSAEQIAAGDWGTTVAEGKTYAEVAGLAHAFRRMQQAIKLRDQQLREQNQTLADTNDQLQRANGNYMQTLGFVTHELKSPLAAIQGFIDLLVGGLAGDVPEKARHYLTRIKRNCEELQDMVKNYLDLSRAERGELAADKKPIDFRAEVIDPSVTQAEALFQSRKMTLETECPEGLRVEADPELMRIALGNFLSNAAKYGREGGQARLQAADDGRQLTVCVWNEGPGFSEEDRKLLFAKFSRLRNPNTRDKRGSGLGLYLCKQVLDLHGGEAWAESEPGQWAKFCFRIPISAS